ncbi:MAG TPA: hypothetical protein VG605_05430 [Puia sp.]|nr:hypothetical protein [Puia sp.]
MKKHSLTKPKDVQEGKPSRATFHHGSTTQAGSNYGQGSNDLKKQSIQQGSETNAGSNYDNEKGWNNEMLRRSDAKQSRKAAKEKVAREKKK